jgi:hypothetical protein
MVKKMSKNEKALKPIRILPPNSEDKVQYAVRQYVLGKGGNQKAEKSVYDIVLFMGFGEYKEFKKRIWGEY